MFDHEDARCKLEDYSRTVAYEMNETKSFILNQAANDWSNSLENQQLELLLSLNSTDKMIQKLD